jgi:hypothetical protein
MTNYPLEAFFLPLSPSPPRASSNPLQKSIPYTLGVDIYGPYVADRVIEYGEITTAYGIDLVTGMPVLVFTSDAPLILENDVTLEHPNLALTLEHGVLDERFFVVQALPMGYSHVKSLRGVALEHFYEGARAALAYLREKGRPHGAVRTHHLWWDGENLLLAGAGLPWTEAATPENDVGALEGLVAGLTGTPDGVRPAKPKLGFVPRSHDTSSSSVPSSSSVQTTSSAVSDALKVSSVLALAPQTAPGVQNGTYTLSSKFLPPESQAPESLALETDAVLRVEKPPARLEPTFVSARTSETKSAPFTTPTLDMDSSVTVVSSTVVSSTVVSSVSPSSVIGSSSTPTASTPTSSTHSSLDESTEPKAGRTTSSPSEILDAQGVLRIGFEEDDSWRKVKLRPSSTSGSTLSRNPILLLGLGALAAALLIGGGAFFLLRPAPASNLPSDLQPVTAPTNDTCCVVNFSLEQRGKPVTQQARLLVVEAPTGSPLKAGDALGIIPGPVRLPANPAKYSLLVQLEGFEEQTLDLEMPSSQAVVIELP